MSISQTVVADKPTDTETNIPDYIRDFIRGVKIDFTPPPIVQNSGSYFILNVTLTRTRTHPIIFSIVVFMKLKDEFGRDHAVRIGSKPYVFFPPKNESITVCIPCITQHELASDASCLFSGVTSKYDLPQGSIGVRIDKVGRWIIDDILWRMLTKDEIDAEKFSEWPSQATQFISFLESISTIWKNFGPISKFGVISSLSLFLSHVNAKNKTTVWKDTNILPSFISSSNISMNATIENKTDNTGHFTVNVTIKNNLDIDVHALVCVDMSDQSFVNKLVPMFKGYTIYNVGYWKCFVSKHGNNWTKISCNFPGKGFEKKYYQIVAECTPYIDVGKSNIYGLYFFTIRWNTFIKPFYIVNESVSNQIKNMWFNTPIFYENPLTPGQIFQTQREQTLYQGKTSGDILINEATQSILDQPIFLLLIVFLIGTPYTLIILLIYRNIRNTNRKIIRKRK